jgi:hypothetical protein
LPLLGLLALRLADDERAAANVFRFVKLIFCQLFAPLILIADLIDGLPDRLLL